MTLARLARTIPLAVVVAAAVAVAPPAAADEQVDYVALGDSFTSGSGIPNQIDIVCTRSDRNYPHLVAEAIGAELTDASCGGAVIGDMTGRQFGFVPPQFDALKPDTDLVTVSIGGNDLPFGEIVVVCGGLGIVSPIGKPCTNHYNAGGTDQIAARMPALQARLAEVVDGIQERSPNARVLFVGVPSVLPESGSCWGPNMPVAPGDYAYLVKVTKNLNATFKAAAEQAGAEFADIYTGSVGHDICKPVGTRWVEGVFPGEIAAPVHPNARGAAGAAVAVQAAIEG